MPGFRVSINGKELVSVSTDGINILCVQVNGDVVGEELAELQVYGGSYRGEEDDTHFIWVNEHKLNENDEIEIILLESVTTSCQGKRIEEIYPKSEESTLANQTLEELFTELSKEPKLRDHFSFKLQSHLGEKIHLKTDGNEYSFNFNVMWKWLHPEKASVWLTSNTLHGIKKQKNGEKHAQLSLQYKQSVKFSVST